ncbi:MAG: hypothetical protein ACK4K9_04310 [Bacteroidia bacterium]
MQTEQHLKAALQKLVFIYCNGIGKPVVVNNIWQIISNTKVEFLERIKQLDEFTENNSFLDNINDLLFDLALVYHLSVEVNDEDYFETKEWSKIEDKSIGRGSELLNMLLYIDEALSYEIEISLDDFLNEHLLVDDDDLRQDVDIYEPLIANPDIVDAEVDTIIELRKKLKDSYPLKQFIVPITLYFKHSGEDDTPDYSDKIDLFENAVFECLLSFERGN